MNIKTHHTLRQHSFYSEVILTSDIELLLFAFLHRDVWYSVEFYLKIICRQDHWICVTMAREIFPEIDQSLVYFLV